jgi:hypothetical protein
MVVRAWIMAQPSFDWIRIFDRCRRGEPWPSAVSVRTPRIIDNRPLLIGHEPNDALAQSRPCQFRIPPLLVEQGLDLGDLAVVEIESVGHPVRIARHAGVQPGIALDPMGIGRRGMDLCAQIQASPITPGLFVMHDRVNLHLAAPR